jgi:molybdenum storage protein
MRGDNSGLTELGKRLISGSLSDMTLQRATEQTPDFAILPWVNTVKIGGQSIMDRGRSAVMPLIDEIVANLPHHKMILGIGAGTRARHIYSLAIDLGMPVGVLTVLGTAVAWQNAQMLQYLLAKHGIAFLEPEGFASLPHYLMERGAVICQGMPPYKLWEENPEIGRIPTAAHRHGLLPDRGGLWCAQDDLCERRRRALHRRPKKGPGCSPHSAHQRAGAPGAGPGRSRGRAGGSRLDADRMAHSRNSVRQWLKPGQLSAALAGDPVGTIIFNAEPKAAFAAAAP